MSQQISLNFKKALFVAVFASVFFIISAILSIASAYTITQINVSEENDFVLEPGKTEILLEPGETVVRYISVTNRVNREADFTVKIEDLMGSDDPRQTVVLLGDEIGPYSLKDFLTPDILNFKLLFGERITIPVTITIPATTPPGGYYGAVIVSNAKDVSSRSSAVSEAEGKTKVISRIGTLFLIRVKGETKEEGSLDGFKTIDSQKVFFEGKPKGFEFLYRNIGSVHLVPYGEIIVRNIFGRNIGHLPVDAYFSLPESLRYRQIDWTSSKFLLGYYTATINLNRGYGNIIDTEKISFWVIPWKVIVPVVLAVFLLMSIFYWIATRFEFKRKK